MNIALIAALAHNRVMGHNNQLPWHLPADLQYFKHLTLGKPIVMGRRTFESIGKILPGRHNIIVSHDRNYQIASRLPTNTTVSIVHSLSEAFDAVPSSTEEIMIIGGAQLFNETLSSATRLYLTLIDASITGDTFFPKWKTEEWREIFHEAHEADALNPYNYTFITLEKK